MRPRFTWLSLLVLYTASGIAFAQPPTTVQLPTYSYFTTNSTVSVPDRGSVYLGGVNRAATGMSEFGTPLVPFRNRSLGSERSASGAWVSVYIHDFEAMDEYLLSQPTPSRGLLTAASPTVAPRLPARQPSGAVAPLASTDPWKRRLDAATQGSAGPLGKSLAELRAEHQREQEARQQEAVQWLERGRQAEAAGKANVARVYYQMAARRASDPLKAEIAARLAALSGPAAASKVASTSP